MEVENETEMEIENGKELGKEDKPSDLDNFELLGNPNWIDSFKTSKKILYMCDKANTFVELKIIIRRLLRGLCSSKVDARAGSFATLILALRKLLVDNRMVELDFDAVETMIQHTIKPSKKEETCEAIVGQSLAYSALVYSKVIKKPEDVNKIASNLARLALKRDYLHYPCYEALSSLISQVDEEFESDILIKDLKTLETNTFNKLFYLINLEKAFPDSNTLKEVFNKKIFSKHNAEKLAKLIISCKDTPKKPFTVIQSASNIFEVPNHPFLEEFAKNMVENKKFLVKFWKHFSAEVPSQGHVMLTLISLAINLLESEYIPMIFNETVCTVLLNYADTKHEIVSKILNDTSKILTETGTEDEKLKFLENVIFSKGRFNFDSVTGTKTTIKIITSLNETNIKQIAIRYELVMNDSAYQNSAKVSALSFYTRIINHQSCIEDTEWRTERLTFLLKKGFFQDGGASVSLSDMAKETFYDNFIHHNNMKAISLTVSKLKKKFEKALEQNNIRAQNKVIEKCVENFGLVKKIKKSIASKNYSDNELIDGLYTLASFKALLTIKERDSSTLTIKEIATIIDEFDPVKDTDKKVWLEVLIDLMLKLLTTKIVSQRLIINQLFKLVIPYMNQAAFKLLIKVLKSNYNALNENEDEMSGTDSDENEDESENEDEKNIENGDVSSDSDTDDSEDDDDGEDFGDKKNDNQEKLQQELRQVLGNDNSDCSSVDIDDIDEEEGKRLDAALSQAFKNASIKSKDSQRKRNYDRAQFSIRVLNLIEIYAKVGMDAQKWIYTINTLVPLTELLVEKKGENSLKSKLSSFLQWISSCKIEDGNLEESIDEVLSLFQEILVKVCNGSSLHSTVFPQLFGILMFLLKNYYPVNKTIGNKFLEIITSSIDQFFTLKKHNMIMNFLLNLCNKSWPGMALLFPVITSYVFTDNNIEIKKKTMGLDLIQAYFKNPKIFTECDNDTEKNLNKFKNVLKTLDTKQCTPHFCNSLWLLLITIHDANLNCFKPKVVKEIAESIYNRRDNNIDVIEKKNFLKMCTKLGLKFETNFTKIKTENQPKNQQAIKRKKEDTRKLKKKSKFLRLEAMDGLEQSDFSKCNLEVDE